MAFTYYQPEDPPHEIEELPAYLARELRRIAEAVASSQGADMIVTHVAPTKPRIGDLRIADGTNWNPGGGAGAYEYTGGGVNGWRMLSTGVQY